MVVVVTVVVCEEDCCFVGLDIGWIKDGTTYSNTSSLGDTLCNHGGNDAVHV